MRLLILLGGQLFSGAEITTLRLAAALSSRWEVAVAVHPASAARVAAWPFRRYEWRHESAPGDTLLRASHFAAPPPIDVRLDEIVADFEPDRVLACMYPVAMLAQPVLEKHTISLLIHHQLMYKDLPHHPIAGAVRRVSDYAEVVIAASRAVEKPLLRSGIENVVVIPAGISSNYGAPRSPGNGRLRILSVATWGPQKGLDTLLKATGQLYDEQLEFDLNIVGPLNRYSEAYGRRMRRLAPLSVRFSGETPTPETHYRNADILVVPSSEPDPYPTVTLEGMAHGLAVVATDCGGLGEQVGHEQTGLLVSPSQPASMAAALRTLVCDREMVQQMGRRGMRRVRAIADLQTQAERLARVLDSLSLPLNGDEKKGAE